MGHLEETKQRTFWRSKVYHVAILFEHVDLFDRLNRLGIQFLQSGLQLFVIADSRLVDLLCLSSWCTLATEDSDVSILKRLR